MGAMTAVAKPLMSARGLPVKLVKHAVDNLGFVLVAFIVLVVSAMTHLLIRGCSSKANGGSVSPLPKLMDIGEGEFENLLQEHGSIGYRDDPISSEEVEKALEGKIKGRKSFFAFLAGEHTLNTPCSVRSWVDRYNSCRTVCRFLRSQNH